MAHEADIILQHVQSSNINAIGHDSETNTLVIEFKRGGKYSYNPVTEGGYRALISAPSIGKYFQESIRNNSSIEATKL